MVWSDIPTQVLRAELVRRQDDSTKAACGSGKGRGSYNTSLHLAALVLILVVSTAGQSHFVPSPQASADQHHSVFFSHHSPPSSPPPRAPSFPIPLPPFWHWRPHCNRIRASPAYRLLLPDRPMSSLGMESGISSHGGAHCHDVGAGRGGH